MFLFNICEGKALDESPVYRVANGDGRGSGDVIRAVESLRSPSTPGRARHPALNDHTTRDEAVRAMCKLGDDLMRCHGGACEMVSDNGEIQSMSVGE